MKFDVLRSLSHNMAHSLASGCGLMIGVYDMDIYGEARASGGAIEVDLLAGTVVRGEATPSLQRAIALYAKGLPAHCERHGALLADFRRCHVLYFWDRGHQRFLVDIEDAAGRQARDTYEALSGRAVG